MGQNREETYWHNGGAAVYLPDSVEVLEYLTGHRKVFTTLMESPTQRQSLAWAATFRTNGRHDDRKLGTWFPRRVFTSDIIDKSRIPQSPDPRWSCEMAFSPKHVGLSLHHQTAQEWSPSRIQEKRKKKSFKLATNLYAPTPTYSGSINKWN